MHINFSSQRRQIAHIKIRRWEQIIENINNYHFSGELKNLLENMMPPPAARVRQIDHWLAMCLRKEESYIAI